MTVGPKSRGGRGEDAAFTARGGFLASVFPDSPSLDRVTEVVA